MASWQILGGIAVGIAAGLLSLLVFRVMEASRRVDEILREQDERR